MIRNSTSRLLSRLNLNSKFLVIYICCVIIPIFVTDGIILRALVTEEKSNYEFARKQEIAAYEQQIKSLSDYDIMLARAIDENTMISNLLDKSYSDPYEYYCAYYDYVRDSFFKSLISLRNDKIVIYADNPTIRNGNYFRQLSTAEGEQWYRLFRESGRDEALLVFTDKTERYTEQRKYIYCKRIKNANSRSEKIITITNMTSTIAENLRSIPTTSSIYVIVNDDYVAFSSERENLAYSKIMERFEDERYSTTYDFYSLNTKFTLYSFSEDITIFSVFRSNIKLLIVMMIVTFVLPLLIMKLIENSIIKRINKLQDAFVGGKHQTFRTIKQIEGTDEIAELMKNYNKMVRLNNELTNTIYKEKLKEQENDIARKNAELLALQSQINPHFLFNALESIRMHSILKGEDETAEMVEKLAVMERQNVDWQEDSVTIGAEAEFIEAYLQLQSYRFGDRLSFDIDIEEGCENFMIPKLTLVTFVENACVHGIESKSTQGWIFVKVYRDEAKENLFIEVEDTGDGMKDLEVARLSKLMNTVTIDTIKMVKHVGILNACLRMKMMFNEKAKFFIESEQGIGMAVIISIPTECLKTQSQEDEGGV
ncbi:MAG: histidine kinase [Clostridiales bacterium]|nr:histidine kinase [Clostridiales bacterium]